MTDKIHVIITREGEYWLAQGVEHDIRVQADKFSDLHGRFEVAVSFEKDEDGKLDHIAPAPKHLISS